MISYEREVILIIVCKSIFGVAKGACYVIGVSCMAHGVLKGHPGWLNHLFGPYAVVAGVPVPCFGWEAFVIQ